MKKVLVLGAGMVARPLVAYLLAKDDLAVTVADVDGRGRRPWSWVAASGKGLSLSMPATSPPWAR